MLPVPTVRRLHMASSNYLDGRINVYAYLVFTGSEVLLIDTGIGEGNHYIEQQFEPHRVSITKSLARFGLETGDVSVIINSHLHFDHCGNNQLFPHADIFVQADELSIARTLNYYTVQSWFDYQGARLKSVTGESEILPGITLLPSPGHTPGHQSVLIELEDGNILVAAQAAYTAEEYQRGGDPAEQAHKGLEYDYVQSIANLKLVKTSAVYFSHDDNSAPPQ